LGPRRLVNAAQNISRQPSSGPAFVDLIADFELHVLFPTGEFEEDHSAISIFHTQDTLWKFID
jgi:hypothetical protein